MVNFKIRQGWMIAVALFALGTCGCGNQLPATISGTVMIDGQSLPEGNVVGEVMFYPTAGGAAAYGPIGDGGAYSIRTGGTNGLEPGSYKVTVRVVEVEPEPPGGYLNAPGQKVISPPKYQDREASGLVKEVEPGQNVIDLDLSSS